jgi:hypothetical protein
VFVGVAQDAAQQPRASATALQRGLHADQRDEQERPVRLHVAGATYQGQSLASPYQILTCHSLAPQQHPQALVR